MRRYPMHLLARARTIDDEIAGPVLGRVLRAGASTKDAPWYVVPADDKENARLIISEIILDVFNGLKMAFPKPSAQRRR